MVRYYLSSFSHWTVNDELDLVPLGTLNLTLKPKFYQSSKNKQFKITIYKND